MFARECSCNDQSYTLYICVCNEIIMRDNMHTVNYIV